MIRIAAFALKTQIVGRQSLDTYRELKAADGRSAEDLHSLSKLRSIAHARFAMINSPFYRELYSSHGFGLDDLNDPEAFTSLPFVDKHMLRDRFVDIQTGEGSKRTTALARTGGSTGLPLHILRDTRYPSRALEWRLLDWWGVQAWDDRAVVTRHMLTGKARIRHDLAWLPSRRIQLDAFQVTDTAVIEFADRWNKIKPGFMVGYVGGVLEMTRRLDRLGLRLIPPRAIAVTAAPLTAGVRAEIEGALRSPCYDHYRSAEVPWIAGECKERHGQHVFSDVRRVEVLGEDLSEVPPGVEGEVVVSDLTNKVFPIIRYRLGDISSFIPEDCPCGRRYPRIGAISGRQSDSIRLPDGTSITGSLGHIFDDTPLAVRQFEIVQLSDYSVSLRCVPGSIPAAMEGIRRAERELKESVNGLIPVRLEIVDDIVQVGGKMRFIRSDAPTSPNAVDGKTQKPGLKVLIAIPTFKRPVELAQLLDRLPVRIAEVGNVASVATLVVDNDPSGSARGVVTEAPEALSLQFVVEPTPGAAAARQRALDESGDADILVFIDDDELPLEGWLAALLDTWRMTRPAAVMGRVISTFAYGVDPWQLATGVFERRERPTGLSLAVAAAGNLLLDLAQVRESGVQFDRSIGLAGGEDVLFSRQLVAQGGRIVWCNESRAEDVVPRERLTRAWTMRRAFNGGNSAVHVELAMKSRAWERVGVRIVGFCGGFGRLAAGIVMHGWGRFRGELKADARGLRTAQRGRGMIYASLGYRHLEYARS